MKQFKNLVRPYLIWSFILIVVPLLLIVLYSVTTGGNSLVNIQFTGENFKKIFEPVYMNVFIRSFKLGAITTIISLIIGYMLAYVISRFSDKAQNILILAVTIPTWINMLLRTYAWISLLSDNGIINSLLVFLGLDPVTMMYTDFSVIIGLVCDLLPFMVIPIHTSLAKMDHSLIEAAYDLGARPVTAFWKVTFKLSIPGVVNGTIMVFLLSISSFVIPKLLGGGQYVLIGNLIEEQFISVGDWNFGSAISMLLAVAILIMIRIMKKSIPMRMEVLKLEEAWKVRLNNIYSNLLRIFYIPIIVTMVFSFNSSKSLTRFTGFSLKWYQALVEDRNIMSAVGVSLSIAVIATAVATILGTITAIGLSRNRKVVKEWLINVNNIPIMNPEIVTAIGLMILFSSMKIDRGYVTMLLAHICFCTPYVITSVYPKVRSLDPNLANAAMDLGATPFQALTKVIVPMIKPGIYAGMLLSFTMSLDDFVISYFVTGNGVANISIVVYNMTKRTNPTINALSAIVIVIIIVTLLIVNLVPEAVKKRQEKTAEKNKKLIQEK